MKKVNFESGINILQNDTQQKIKLKNHAFAKERIVIEERRVFLLIFMMGLTFERIFSCS